MKRTLLILVGFLAVIVVTSVAAITILFTTSAGQSFIIARVEPILEDTLGGDVKISSLKGDLPGNILVSNIILSDEQGHWATIDELEITWRPFRLFQKKIDIEKIDIRSATLLRPPPEQTDEFDDDPQRFSLQLPSDLPTVKIDALTVTNFRSKLEGANGQFSGIGTIDIGGRQIVAHLSLKSISNTDVLAIDVDLRPDANRFYIDGVITSEEAGLIATLAQIDGPLKIEIESDASVDDARIKLVGAIGAYGDINATLSGDLNKIVSAKLVGVFNAGATFDEIEELAGPVNFDVGIEERGRGGAITIYTLTSAVGEITGAIDWINSRAALKDFSVSVNVIFAEGYRNSLQKFVGSDASFSGQIQRQRQRFAIEGTLSSPNGVINIAEGTTDLQNQFAGIVRAMLSESDAHPLLQSPIDLSVILDIDRDKEARARSLSVNIENGSSLSGAGIYDFVDSEIDFDGEITLAPALISSLIPSINPAGNVSADLTLSGQPNRFTINVNGETPVINIGDGQAPPLIIEAAFAGLPSLPTGDIKARAVNGAGFLNATVRSSENGQIAVPEVIYRGDGFALKGDGSFSPITDSITLALTYEGDNDAQPWPGLQLTGDVQASGVIARARKQTDLTLSANRVATPSLGLSNLQITAKGAPTKISVTATAEELTTTQTGPIEQFRAEATADISGDPKVILTMLNGLAVNNRFSLSAPTEIKVSDELTVDNFRLNWGRIGRIALDGEFSSTRWRATSSLNDVNIPGADGIVSADIYLDTNEPFPSRGALVLQSLLARAPEESIKMGFVWNGEQVTFKSASDEDALEMNVSIPATLSRTPTITVATGGALNGYIRYDGQISPIAAYLPAELQTLEGALNANVDISGTIANPELIGKAAITDGAYTELQTGLSFDGLNTKAEASYAGDRSLVRFSGGARGAGQTGGDTILINGNIELAETSRMDLTIQLKNAELSAHPVSNIRANGVIEISGPLDNVTANGDITIEELNAEIITPENTGLAPIEVLTLEQQASDQDNFADKTPQTSVDFTIKINANDRIFVRGRGLESEWSADVTAIDDKDTALILGTLTLRKGWIDFSGRRFNLTRGGIRFDRLAANNPLLDIRAEYETSEGVTAIIAVSGRAQEPTIALLSTPSLPPGDVMALILFGKPAGELSAIESLQAAQALASLGGIGPFGGSGLTGSLRKATGLDLLNFDLDPEKGGGSLTVGKYVTDGLFVSATQDAQGDNGSVRVEYEITDSITVETEVKQDGDQTVSANWKLDF